MIIDVADAVVVIDVKSMSLVEAEGLYYFVVNLTAILRIISTE